VNMNNRSLTFRLDSFVLYAIKRSSVWLLVMFTAVSGSANDQADGTIDVSGAAEIYAIPNEVLVSASIDSRGKTVMEASEENDKLVQSVKIFLKKSGVEDRYIRTEYLSLRPEYPQTVQKYAVQDGSLPKSAYAQKTDGEEADSLKPIGYTAVRSFSIVIRDVTKFETIYQGMLQLGVNRIDGVQFRTSDLRKLRDQARLDAVKAAREKASAMASELGVSLSGVKLIEENNSRISPFGSNSARMDVPGAEESSSTGGEIAISASVRVVFFLSPKPAKTTGP